MQPQPVWTEHGRNGPAKTTATLALIAACLVLGGWFLPYISFSGESASLSDDAGSSQIVVIGPAVLAGVTALIALGGSRGAATLAAGAAAGVASLCLVLVAVTFEIVSESDGFWGYSVDYSVGFFLHIAAAVLALIALVKAFAAVHGDGAGAQSVNPAAWLLGLIGIVASAVGFLLPEDGYSIFDIESGPIKASYLVFTAILALSGIVGFSSQRAAGAAIGFGASVTPLFLWISDAIERSETGQGFWGGFSDGNLAIVTIGAMGGAVCGIIGMASANSAGQPLSSTDVAAHSAHPLGSPHQSWQQPAPQFAQPSEAQSWQPSEPQPWQPPDAHAWQPTESSWAPREAESADPTESFGSVSADVPVVEQPALEAPVADVSAHAAVPSDQPPEGWYPDPLGRHAHRYWNGSDWTEHVANGSVTAIDPI